MHTRRSVAVRSWVMHYVCFGCPGDHWPGLKAPPAPVPGLWEADGLLNSRTEAWLVYMASPPPRFLAVGPSAAASFSAISWTLASM